MCAAASCDGASEGLSEFDLIYQQIAPNAGASTDVLLGIGDDAALCIPPSGQTLVTAMDTLVAGRHFFVDQAAEDLGWKSLAVNLSDLAAMGAAPAWALLSLALPEHCASSDWITRFMSGWQVLAGQYGLVLVGGDTTRSDCLTISVTVVGFRAQTAAAMIRSAAQVGDDIWVSGSIGGAGLALQHRLRHHEDAMPELAQRLHRPMPRVALGQALLPFIHAAIDVSDGLLSDIGHILLTSGGLGAEIAVDQVPMLPVVRRWAMDDVTLPLVSGDDYELLFTAPPSIADQVQSIADACAVPVTRIGRVCVGEEGLVLTLDGQKIALPSRLGFDHFG